MKLTTALVSALLVVASFSFSFSAQANEQLAVSLCEYVAANDKRGLRKKIKSSRIKIRNIFDGIMCNGNNLLRHAIASNAVDAGEFIVKNLPKSKLADGSDIAWAESNGHGGSALIGAIKARAGL